MKITIIIPCFNCSLSIFKLINSLKNQSSSQFEVIFINDCSSDNTLDILQEFSRTVTFDCSVINNEKNLGPGIARNIGINNVKTEYLMFVDSDDFLEINAIEKLVYYISVNKDVDCILFNYFYDFKSGSKIRCTYTHEKNKITREDSVLYSTSAPWCKVYRTNVIKDNYIYFPNLKVKEDFVFNKLVLLKCENIIYFNTPLYHYVNVSNSIMNSTKLKGPYVSIEAFNKIYELIDEIDKPIIKKLEIKENLYASVQSLVRIHASNDTIMEFIKSFSNNNLNWSNQYRTLNFEKYVKLSLFLIEKNWISLLKITIKLKDWLKNK